VTTYANPYCQAAYERGREAALSAASWTEVRDANAARRLLQMIEDGDPQAEQYLPNRPNLHATWGGEETPSTLYDAVVPCFKVTVGRRTAKLRKLPDVGFHHDQGHNGVPTRDEITDAWEQGVQDTFEDACVTELKKAL
jgi:hypothetical protein